LERNWFSSAYYNSPMPYSIFFHNGYAIHGSSAIDKLGGPASHGCVRLHPHHAALLFDLVQQEGPGNTTIEVTDEARPQQPSLPGRDIPSLPGREIAAEQGPYPPVPRIIRYREPGEMPELAPAPRSNRSILARNVLPPRLPAAVTDEARPEESSLSGRQIAAAQGLPAPGPRVVRYRETAAMPELTPTQRGNRSIAARNVLPPKPAPAAHRPLPTDVVAEGSSPATTTGQAQQAPSVYGLKVLPASCWSGGASRWRWWTSSQGTPCK
jgi:hypothetical protein